jgi:hypothetical protein
MTRSPATLERLRALSGDSVHWAGLSPRPGFDGWSDDHASMLPVIRWDNFFGGLRRAMFFLQAKSGS